MAQWVKDLALSQLWLGFSPWSGNVYMLQVQSKKKKKNQRRKKKTMRLTSAVFLPALAMNIDLILFGFVTTVFLTFLLSLFRALSSFPVGRELI